MQPSQFDIYIDKRPLRIAFLIEQFSPGELINAIIKYNQEKWGGRFNPIFITDGKSLDEESWHFIQDYDPDIIKSFVPLENELIEKINIFLSPYLLDAPENNNPQDKDYHSIHLNDNGLSIFPTKKNIYLVSQYFINESELVLFEFSQQTEDILKYFIIRNFGSVTPYIHIKEHLEQIKKRTYSITNRENMANAFVELSSFNNFTYPIQLCTLPNSFKDTEYDRNGQTFTVIVGNSIEDITYHWNRVFFNPHHKRTFLNQIWLPTELANDSLLEDPLKKWLKRVADPAGSINEDIQFVSFSLTNTELQSIAERLTKDIWIRKSIMIYQKPQRPIFREIDPIFNIKKDKEFYKGTGMEEQIILTPPNKEEFFGGGQWMADVYIQYTSDHFKNFINLVRWWQLPKRNNLAHHILQKRSRIMGNGFPSVSMSNNDLTLNIKIPEDAFVFWALLEEENKPYLLADPRTKLVSKKFSDVKPSDKGRYLTGFLDLFSGLSSAYFTLKERYWRRIFDILSHQNPAKDDHKIEVINKKLMKQVKSCGEEFFSTEKGLQWLSKYILQVAKEHAIYEKEIPYKHFIRIAKEELEEYNSGQPVAQQFNQSEEEIIENLNYGIQDLIEENILLLGIRPHCPLCTYANWYHVDEIKQELECKGCGYKFPIKPEEEWYYKLNTLINIGCAQHGLVPVILVLGQLLEDSRSSFIMTPSVELYKPGESTPFSDLDIVCIQDGKFIIGEVKQSIGLFKTSDFNKMADIAEIIRPDIVIFSSLDRIPNQLVSENISILKERLSPLDITVEWYPLNSYIFDASPV